MMNDEQMNLKSPVCKIITVKSIVYERGCREDITLRLVRYGA